MDIYVKGNDTWFLSMLESSPGNGLLVQMSSFKFVALFHPLLGILIYVLKHYLHYISVPVFENIGWDSFSYPCIISCLRFEY